MTTTQTPQQAADSIVELLGSLATNPTNDREPVDKMSVYWSASACNRKGGWIANVTRGCLVQHVELRSAKDQESAETAAAARFYIREQAA